MSDENKNKSVFSVQDREDIARFFNRMKGRQPNTAKIDGKGDTPLAEFNARSKSHIKLINKSMQDLKDSARLFKAVRSGDISSIQHELDSGTDINLRDVTGQNVLHVAAGEGMEKVCDFLMEKAPQLIDRLDNFGKSPLHKAMENKHENIATKLALHGARLEAPAPPPIFDALAAGKAYSFGPSGVQPLPKPEPPPGNPDAPLSSKAFDRIRAKISEHQVRRAKNLALQRKRSPGKAGR